VRAGKGSTAQEKINSLGKVKKNERKAKDL
jgi:hypothetical protein